MEPWRAREILEGSKGDPPELAVRALHDVRAQLDLDDPEGQALAEEMHDATRAVLLAHPDLHFDASQWTLGSDQLREQYDAVPTGLERADAADPSVTPERLEQGARDFAARGAHDSPERAARRAEHVQQLQDRASALRVVRDQEEHARRLERERREHPSTRDRGADRDR